VPQAWAKLALRRQLANLIYDNGPHSLTRVVLRRRLFDQAKGSGAKARSAALALSYLLEEGCLMALLDSGSVGHDYLQQLLSEVRANREPGVRPGR